MKGVDVSHVSAAVHLSPLFQDDAAALHGAPSYNPDAALSKRPNGPPSKTTILEVIKTLRK